MLNSHRICSVLLVLILTSIVTPAQNETARSNNGSDGTVTASATGGRVRFTAPSAAVQIRLEVYNSAGKKLFDNEVRSGNVLDWHLLDGQAEPLPHDSYLCVITVKSLSGRLTQRIGTVTIEKDSAAVQPVDASQITEQQSQAIGPVEENASLTVLKEDDNRTTTLIAHNGEDGLITRGRGALSFLIGDFFSGKDTEQMRLTTEGNLGIGITHPQARLDVDGLIRASGGIMFPDGTIQTTAAIAGNASQGNGGQSQTGQWSKPGKQTKASGGTGKGKNTISPEFMVNEDLTVNGNIVFTSGALGRDITRQDNNGGIRIFANPTLTGTPATAAIQFFGNGHPAFPGQAYVDSGANDNAAVIFRTAETGGTIAERMRITATGFVGIGRTTKISGAEVFGVQSNFGDGQFGGMYMKTDSATGLPFYGYSLNGAISGYHYIDGNDGGKWKLNVGNGDDVLVVTPGGNVGIGTTSPLYLDKLDVRSNAGTAVSATETSIDGRGVSAEADNGSFAIGIRATSTSGLAGLFFGNVDISSTGAKAGNLTAAGNVCSANISCSSDARLKKNISNLSYGLPEVMRLRPVSWHWKDKIDDKQSFGLIAQEVAPVMPELVLHNVDEKGSLGLKYMDLIPVLIRAFQEQHTDFAQKDAEIASIKAENAALKQRNAELDARITALEQAMQQLMGQQARRINRNSPNGEETNETEGDGSSAGQALRVRSDIK